MKFTTVHTPTAFQPEDAFASDSKKGVMSDRVILFSVIMLMVFGLLAVFSAITYFAEVNGNTATNLAFKHGLKLVVAFVTMIFISKVDYRTILKFSKITLIISWGLLLLVSMGGQEIFGAKRWLTVGGLAFQPSTIASISLILVIASLLADKQEYIKSFEKAFLPTMFWIGITCALIAKEDFSTAGILFMICLVMLFVGRMNLLYLIAIVALGGIGASSVVLSSPERVSRIENYLHQVVDIEDEEFALGGGYQAQQAQIAVARGSILGVGIGKSTQRDFLPAPYNDFIFAIIAEEYGLIGAGAVLFLYILILFRGVLVVARKATDLQGMLVALGCTLMISLYAFVNAGVAVGLLPVTGLPMPFVSYGGTNMVIAGALVGILLNISKRVKSQKSGAPISATSMYAYN